MIIASYIFLALQRSSGQKNDNIIFGHNFANPNMVYGRVLEQKEWSTTTVIYGINLQGDPLQYA